MALGRKKKPEDESEEEEKVIANVHPDKKSMQIELSGNRYEQEDLPEPEPEEGDGLRGISAVTADVILRELIKPSKGNEGRFTVTTKQQINSIITMDAIEQFKAAQRKGEMNSLARIYLQVRDTRYPSLDGESLKAILRVHDAMKKGQEQQAALGEWKV